MATSSFDREFVVKDEAASQKFLKAMGNPQPVRVSSRDLSEDIKKGTQLLKRLYTPLKPS